MSSGVKCRVTILSQFLDFFAFMLNGSRFVFDKLAGRTLIVGYLIVDGWAMFPSWQIMDGPVSVSLRICHALDGKAARCLLLNRLEKRLYKKGWHLKLFIILMTKALEKRITNHLHCFFNINRNKNIRLFKRNTANALT